MPLDNYVQRRLQEVFAGHQCSVCCGIAVRFLHGRYYCATHAAEHKKSGIPVAEPVTVAGARDPQLWNGKGSSAKG